jgi:hypothetical protein
MEVQGFGDGRKALRFGNHKINLHETSACLPNKHQSS